jgi:hypothetical protein
MTIQEKSLVDIRGLPVMTVEATVPPIYDKICAAFPRVPGKHGVIYAWGRTIYNPDMIVIPKDLAIHEAMHGIRQEVYEGGVIAWWERYLIDRDFRLVEEVMAHKAEATALLAKYGMSRASRRKITAHVASRLANPVYQFGIDRAQAERLLEA